MLLACLIFHAIATPSLRPCHAIPPYLLRSETRYTPRRQGGDAAEARERMSVFVGIIWTVTIRAKFGRLRQMTKCRIRRDGHDRRDAIWTVLMSGRQPKILDRRDT